MPGINVVMFHSIGNDHSKWYRHWLSVSLVHFENYCRFLKNEGYQTLQLDDWYELQDKPGKQDKKTVFLTFDDGYLDNWVFAYPVMKKYGIRGTIFINPEFVDPSTDCRPTYDEVLSGGMKIHELQTLGMLNWEEIKKLDTSRVMDVQSHSMSHNFYFRSDLLVDIYEGQPKYDWLAWFEKPDRKPYYMQEDQSHFLSPGYPVFEFGRALGVRRYFPSPELARHAATFTSANHSFKKEALILELNSKLTEFPGRMETDEEMEERFRYELFESKRILEEKLEKKINFLCWPGGGYTDMSIRLSIEAGYKASTIGSSEWNLNPDNSGPYKRIRRFGMGSFNRTPKRYHYITNRNYLVHHFRGMTGNTFFRNLNRARRVYFLLLDKFI
jgi:peptidoglycan/xylan/chitin deacetylase (PgdA/CDA1 family)